VTIAGKAVEKGTVHVLKNSGLHGVFDSDIFQFQLWILF